MSASSACWSASASTIGSIGGHLTYRGRGVAPTRRVRPGGRPPGRLAVANQPPPIPTARGRAACPVRQQVAHRRAKTVLGAEAARLAGPPRRRLRAAQEGAAGVPPPAARPEVQALPEPLQRGGRQARRADGTQAVGKNPNLCQYCFDHLPPGGIELDIGVVFVDVRASTSLAEGSTATEFAARFNRFYSTATDVLIRHDAIIDKLIGDEVMALFLPGLAGSDYRQKTVDAALDLAASVDDLPIGVAANAGISFVGNVGSGTVLDFTAVGDAVNVGARLQGCASAGQVVLAADLYRLVAEDHPGASHETIAVRVAASRWRSRCSRSTSATGRERYRRTAGLGITEPSLGLR